MLKPNVVRKQISPRKFQRIKNSPYSKRVRVFLSLHPYQLNTTIESYTTGDGWVYVYHGEMKEDMYSLAKIKPLVFRTYYYRYKMNEAVCIAGRVV